MLMTEYQGWLECLESLWRHLLLRHFLHDCDNLEEFLLLIIIKSKNTPFRDHCWNACSFFPTLTSEWVDHNTRESNKLAKQQKLRAFFSIFCLQSLERSLSLSMNLTSLHFTRDKAKRVAKYSESEKSTFIWHSRNIGFKNTLKPLEGHLLRTHGPDHFHIGNSLPDNGINTIGIIRNMT